MTDVQPIPFRRHLALTAQRVGGEVVFLPGDRATLTGAPGEVGQLLAVIQGAGRLVSSSTPAPTGVPGQVLVNVRLAPPVQAHVARQTQPRRQLPRWVFWSVACAVAAAVAGLGQLVRIAITAIAANPALTALVAVCAVAAAVLLARAASGRKGGQTFSGTFRGRID